MVGSISFQETALIFTIAQIAVVGAVKNIRKVQSKENWNC